MQVIAFLPTKTVAETYTPHAFFKESTYFVVSLSHWDHSTATV